jgi:thymidine kinase
MFSGKSTELIRRTSCYKAIGKKILRINHLNDTRTDDNIQTHSNIKKNAIKVSSLMTLVNNSKFISSEVIGIDEAQFFDDLYEFIITIEPLGKIIIVSGLDGDFKRRPIGQILQIIPLCDEVVKLHALDMVDKDGSPGIFTKRLSENNELIVIGAENEYMAVSRKNYFTNRTRMTTIDLSSLDKFWNHIDYTM